MLDHVALEVSDLERSARFYDAVMRALGGRRIVSSREGVGYGRDRAVLWLLPAGAQARPPGGHLAIAALGRRAVDAAHAAGLAAGGRDGGGPAARPFGPPAYYSGYLLDPDGACVELVSGGG